MPSSRLRRPPATFRALPHPEPQYTEVFSPIAVHGFQYKTQYVVTVNPVKEVPRPIQPSLSQPISVAGWRRMVEVGMGAAPYLQRRPGRVHHAPRRITPPSERDRMRGVLARGFTYVQPAPVTGPGLRALNIGGA